jgi:hypothetical protein
MAARANMEAAERVLNGDEKRQPMDLSAAALFLWQLGHTLGAHRGPMFPAVHTVAVVGPLVVTAGAVVEVMLFLDWQADNASPLSDSHAQTPLPASANPRSYVASGQRAVRQGTARAGRGSNLYRATPVRHSRPSPDLLSAYHRMTAGVYRAVADGAYEGHAQSVLRSAVRRGRSIQMRELSRIWRSS